MKHSESVQRPASSEAGFTLIESLIAIVVLVFGIVAVANLMVMAMTNNSVASQSTAAAAAATQVVDTIRSTEWKRLPVNGGSLPTDQGAKVDCAALGTTVALNSTFNCDSRIPGVGVVHVRWQIQQAGNPRLRYIQVQSETTGALGAGRSRSFFTTFRSCTDSSKMNLNNTQRALEDQCPE